MNKKRILFIWFLAIILLQGLHLQAQEAKARWQRLNLIRKEKFDIVLPKAMRTNKIDMWIVMVKRGHTEPLWLDLGGGSPHDWWSKGEFLGYYIFTDRGDDRIERAVLGMRGGFTLQYGGLYDIFGSAKDLKEFVAERDPQRIAVNMSKYLGAADGLSYTCYQHLVKELGEKYAKRLVSSEKLVADFRSHRVASEITLYGEVAEISRRLMERALSNEVIIPGVTTLGDIGWWLADQCLALGLDASPGLPRVIYPKRATSKDYIIQRGDLVALDWGIHMMNFCTDIERMAYVLPEGKSELPPTIKDALQHGFKVRKIIRKYVKPGRSGLETLKLLCDKVKEAGYQICEVEDQVSNSKNIEVNIGWHSVGNLGHGVGPAIWTEKPFRRELEIRPTQIFAFEFFIYYPLPEWQGKKIRIDLEDDVIITENGVEWLYPMFEKAQFIR